MKKTKSFFKKKMTFRQTAEIIASAQKMGIKLDELIAQANQLRNQQGKHSR